MASHQGARHKTKSGPRIETSNGVITTAFQSDHSRLHFDPRIVGKNCSGYRWLQTASKVIDKISVRSKFHILCAVQFRECSTKSLGFGQSPLVFTAPASRSPPLKKSKGRSLVRPGKRTRRFRPDPMIKHDAKRGLPDTREKKDHLRSSGLDRT